MINMRRAVLLLPVYVLLMAASDAVFSSASFDTRSPLPWWLVVGFIAASLVVFFAVTWFLVQKAHGNIPIQRERASTGFLVALIVSGFVDDGLRGLAHHFFHSKSIWLSIPIYVLSYVVLLMLIVLIVNRFAAKPLDDNAKPAP